MSEGAGGGPGGDGPAEPAVATPRSVTTAAGTTSFGAGAPPSARGPGPISPSDRRRAKREAYWNRPKHPKDWRYWVGGTGRVLIVLGLLMFAFVAYQLWGTGIEQARAQDKLGNELEERQAEVGTVPVLIPPSTTTPPTTVTPQPGETTPPPATEAPITEAPVLSLPPIEEGDAIGVLSIPRIGMEQKIVAGVTVADLKQAPGHFPQTPMPGELGNAAIAGHRTTYGGPFLHLDELEVGDEISFTNIYSQVFVYIVTGTEVVSPSDGHVIETTDPTVAKLTLTTCTPVRTSKQRLIIYATLDPTRSPTPTASQIYYGQAPPDSEPVILPGDDTTEPPVAESTVPTSDSAAAPATDAATTAPTTTVAAAADRPDGFSDADPFAQGWFSDSAAWPHVAAWGFALIVLCLACYVLARTLRRRWVGWVVAAAPFVVLLYFFFQNVNRLLPPGL
jgi:sortase A